MNTVIKATDISKMYQIGEFSTGTIASDLQRWWAKKRGNEDPFIKLSEQNDRTVVGDSNLVWSLRDINFEIKQGEAVGIIGRNGAGKSTLLKILSRVTTPTTGTMKVKGRIASLLEVGTGFHPELTGRENVFLNGAILGMKKAEIKRKFDEILAFSGVERYIDTPVKRYSSGMYVRLAFAVAAHLESEILIIDEVLAVGDTEFQKKCLGKMGEVSTKEGRTVLFVSHHMGSIIQLCDTGIFLNNGRIVAHDKVTKVVDTYINNTIRTTRIEKEIQTNENQFSLISMIDKFETDRVEYKHDEELVVRTNLFLPNWNNEFEIAMRLVDKHKRAVFTIHENLARFKKNGTPTIGLKITIPSSFVTPGVYSWVMCINHPGVKYYDLYEEIASFTILDTGSEFARYEGQEYGCVFANYKIES